MKVTQRSSLDVGLGDAITPPIEEIEGADWHSFSGIARAKFEAISLEQHFAEKIHAMTMDHGECENSRVKDLLDLLLLVEAGLNQERVLCSLKNTFSCRGKSMLPQQLPLPPQSWHQPFNQMALECGLGIEIEDAIASLQRYWETLPKEPESVKNAQNETASLAPSGAE